MRLHRFLADSASRPAPRGPALPRLLCAALVLALLPACSWMPFRHSQKGEKTHECNKPQLYEQAQSVPLLSVPAGLDPLNTRAALKIPDLRETEVPRKPSDPCLDEPPKYSNARLLPVPGSGKPQKKHWFSRDKTPAPPSAPAASAPAPVPAPAPVATPAAAPAAPPATP